MVEEGIGAGGDFGFGVGEDAEVVAEVIVGPDPEEDADEGNDEVGEAELGAGEEGHGGAEEVREGFWGEVGGDENEGVDGGNGYGEEELREVFCI